MNHRVVTLRVVIVDDHAAFRSWAAQLLRADRIEVVGAAATAAAGLELAVALRPDLVLLDIRLPDADGFAICPDLVAAGIPVVLCSAKAARDYGDRIALSGALGFLPKERLSAAALRGLLDG
ncbi:response regulator [Actinokineospora soli]|uniref:Response regulator n=1 Tax=Actinokineospora soli TaxID=1048753 RepID=A0ABW2TNK6_9PSEU